VLTQINEKAKTKKLLCGLSTACIYIYVLCVLFLYLESRYYVDEMHVVNLPRF